MKELLKYYKEVRLKANPEFWEKVKREMDSRYYFTKLEITSELVTYQKKQLELEALLHGYWERTVMINVEGETGPIEQKELWTVAKNRLSNPNKYHWFNQWLEKELSKLD